MTTPWLEPDTCAAHNCTLAVTVGKRRWTPTLKTRPERPATCPIWPPLKCAYSRLPPGGIPDPSSLRRESLWDLPFPVPYRSYTRPSGRDDGRVNCQG